MTPLNESFKWQRLKIIIQKSAYLSGAAGIVLLLVAFATPALLWGGVSLECPSELGKVSGNKGIAVKMIVHNLSILSTRVEIPNCHCTSTGTNSTTLGPLASETVEINLATHKFPRGRGSFPLAVGYYLRGAEKMASRTVHYEVVRL